MLALPPAPIAYVHAADLWEMDPSGGDAHRVRRNVLSVTWSGGRLVAASEGRIVSLAPDGTDRRTLVRARGAEAIGRVVASPDGSSLAFGVTDYGSIPPRGGVEIVRADGTGRHELARGSLETDVSGWSANGTVLYDRDDSVYAQPATGGTPRRLVANAREAVPSPDGMQLAFVARRGIVVSGADGGGRQLVFRGPAEDPAWSADGTRLAFASARNVPHTDTPGDEVYSIAADGTCLTWLTDGDLFSAAPAWGPGAAAPDRCGHRDRRPRFDVHPPRGAVWGGRRFRGALLDDALGSRGDYLVTYLDCPGFQRCRTFSLSEDDSCRSGIPYLRRYGRDARRVVARLGHRAATLVGRRFVLGPDARHLRGLHRVDGRRVGPPRLARDAWALLPARLRTVVRPC